MTTPERESAHDAVGAYVLGILDDAEATAFEAHLAGCDVCAVHLEEFSGMEPMLALLAEAPGGPVAEPSNGLSLSPRAGVPVLEPPVPVVPEPASGRLLNGLLDEVAAKRATRRRRGMYLVAAAAALIIGGPLVAWGLTSDGDPGHAPLAVPTSPAEHAFLHEMDAKFPATDPVTKVSAVVGVEKKGWGTHTVLELKNVKGPLKCRLVAISTTGEEETVTSWSVPRWGYGIEDSAREQSRKPLYVHGGAAMKSDEIDRFEVRTFDNRRLVTIEA
ncbi:anti-sigma factor family protein [Streptomyces sp. NPDC057638]|uniref:anti-sigma factor family protein n=1 Tax=Streptomyces sp. NPDC057638 TaxID=3346190 RepID=UPI0036B21E6E